MASQKYIDQVRKELQGGYDSKVSQYKNALQDTLANYNNQIGTTNMGYDNRIKDNTMSTENNKNSFANRNIASGMARSTIANTGVQGIALQGKDQANTINQYRANDLGNINSQITGANNNYASTIAALNSANESDIISRANALDDRDAEIARQQQALAEQRAYEERQSAIQYQRQQANARASASAKASTPKAPTAAQNKSALVNYYNDYKKKGYAAARDWLEGNKLDIQSSVGNTTYNQLAEDLDRIREQENMINGELYGGLSTNSQSTPTQSTPKSSWIKDILSKIKVPFGV